MGNKLFDFAFSRSDEPIVIGVCGMRSSDQDHRIVSEPIASGSFLESGPGDHALNRHPMKIRKYMHTMYIQIQFSIRHPKERMHNILLSAISLQSIKGYLINCPAN